MAIKIKGEYINLSKKDEVVPVVVKDESPKLQTSTKTLVRKEILTQSHNQPLLVVNGKVKKIRKDSMYLIDMLITDEE